MRRQAVKRPRNGWRARVVATGLTAMLAFCSMAALAQPYPARSLRMVIPAGPGGGVDTIARLVGQPLGVALGQSVVMDNRPGAGTMLASELVAKSPPDGYTLLMVTSSHAINASLHKNLRYDPVNDYAAVTLAASVPNLIVVHPSVPAKTAKQLIELARRFPRQLMFASAGSGSGTHLACELFLSMAGVEMIHVPYKSGSSAITDLMGGHVQVMFSNTINAMPHVKSKRLRALAITTPQRSLRYPDFPTVAESGLAGYESDVWYGVLAPGQTPAEIVGRLNREIVGILKTADMKEKLATQGAEAAGSTPEAFAALIRNEITKWGRVTAALKLQMD